MPLSGVRILSHDDYLDPLERERRALKKERELIARRLTPDWFKEGGDLCLPPGGLKVVVIGAGFAGLAAAWYLKTCGVTTTVYEASDRIGGRVLTDRQFVYPKWVEAGAELIGENHPLWRILARGFGLRLVPVTDEDTYSRAGLQVRTIFGGKVLTDPEMAQLSRDLRAPLAEIGKDAFPISETAPWNSKDAAKLDAMSINDKLDVLIGRASSLARSWFEFTLGNDNCARITDQSYLGLLSSISAARMGSDPPGMLGYWMSTETHRCENGNDLLAARLGQGPGSTIRLSTLVDAVVVQPLPFYPPVIVGSVHLDPSGRKIRRRPAEFYDYAILAVPPTVWSSIKFLPSFPPASRTLMHGSAIKFLSRYPTDFWRQARLAPSVKSDQLGSLWEGTDNQPGPPWFDISVFSGGQFVLPAASYPVQLTQLYPTRSISPGSEKFVDWPSWPHIQTGYAVPGRGQASTITPTLMQPHRGRLYFAGEQTSPGFFGYMEGALQSGARAARDIVLAAARPCPGTTSSWVAEDASRRRPGDRPFTGGGGEFGGGGSSDNF
jgi:monoamine oxidase